MARFYPGDYVRPSAPSLGLPRHSVWRVRPSNTITGIRIEPVRETIAGSIVPDAYYGRNFEPGLFEKVIKVRGQWVDAKDADALSAAPVFFTQAVDPGADSVVIADNAVTAAEQRLANAKEQARKQRELAAQKAKEQAKAEREAKAKAEAKAKHVALLLRLQADERLADATKALILEVQRLVKYASPEQIAPQEVYQHADQLDALAKSYGYKIVRAGSKCIVAKA